jgi:hypothetical protein
VTDVQRQTIEQIVQTSEPRGITVGEDRPLYERVNDAVEAAVRVEGLRELLRSAHGQSVVANVRVHGTTGESPQTRFDRDERGHLQPLAAHRYTSLVLEEPAARRTPRRVPRPLVEVEKRSLTVYAQLAGGAA